MSLKETTLLKVAILDSKRSIGDSPASLGSSGATGERVAAEEERPWPVKKPHMIGLVYRLQNCPNIIAKQTQMNAQVIQ